MKKLKDLKSKELIKLKSFRINKLQNLEVKVEAYRKLISEINSEQVYRILPKLRKEENENE